jgi:hypothetical protein
VAEGDITVGNYAGNQGWMWDNSEGKFNIKGVLTVQSGSSGIANLSDAGSLATLSAVGASNCDATIISGGKIITGLLTADNITTGTLTGLKVQTDTGAVGHYQRIVLDQSDNTLRFYNSSNTNVLTIDDDIFASRPGIKAVDATYGGVFQAMKDANNHTSLTRDGVYSKTDSAYATYCPLYIADDYTTGDGQYVVWIAWKSSNTLNISSNGNIRTVGYTKASEGFRVDDSNVGLASDSFEDADGNTFTIKGGLITAKAAP